MLQARRRGVRLQNATVDNLVVEGAQVTHILARAVQLVVQVKDDILLLELDWIKGARFVAKIREAAHHGASGHHG